MSEPQPRSILLVEDNPGDVVMTREAMGRLEVHAELYVVTDGGQAIDYLKSAAGQQPDQLPDLVLLDLNLPVRTGREVLAEVNADPRLHGLLVAILTSSAHEQDACHHYRPEYCQYFQKPPTFRELVERMRDILRFWATRSGR